MDELTVLYEDNHIIVVMKPQGIPSCGDESGDDNLLERVRRYIKEKYKKPGNVFVGLVHRLDRPTGGVMVFAKTSKAAGRLSEQMKSGDFEKKYLAVLVGTPEPPQAKLVNYLKKNPVNNMVYLCPPTTDGAKLASLEYRVLQEKGGLCLADIKLHTGRSHQIRVQMAGISHPVYGDMRYGGANAKKGNLALWAYSLTFTHPVTKERMKFMLEPPADGIPWKAFDLSPALEL
ncbi:MAG TPA: RluA family pseudouridine synthase [Candidatus Borkfalkia excrementavium]|uniref:RNA pseudouridylate synthase n=1 Tax=Candidatus Borkfalkia excrementavium TaxID=2838505 RepID=A0A9D2CER7_9FIRM|nr:RluA family pseudouridine synthase [Candidatus Borkfalkia excrementavium]